MDVTGTQIRGHRLLAHHLDKRRPMDRLLDAAGACGLQNTPPGAWETALFNRLEGCTLHALDDALHGKKTLLQAWSYRGAPVVFPTGQSDVILTPLAAREGEQPWIYTLGITGALEYLQMPFDDVLLRLKEAIACLDSRTIVSKEELDRYLAGIIYAGLPENKRALWRGPSMYGSPEKQTVGAAAVSFLLRPCSFLSLVVFAGRQGGGPAFTSYTNWVGQTPTGAPGADGELVKKFLHCYGPATVEQFAGWLGCSARQARRLWGAAAGGMVTVRAEGRACQMLAADTDSLLAAEDGGERLVLLGAHDPYLDLRDRQLILENTARHKAVWKYSGNPGAVLRGGRVIGIWRVRTVKDRIDVSMTVWERVSPGERQELERLAEEYAAFRLKAVRSFTIDGEEC